VRVTRKYERGGFRYAAHIWPPGDGSSTKLLVVTCSTRCRWCQKPASKAAENSGYSPRNLLRTSKIRYLRPLILLILNGPTQQSPLLWLVPVF
jgi:pyruvate-formate lyase-activating enzyme